MEDLDLIYKRYAKPLYRYVLRISRNETTAEEIVQQTFYKAVLNADKFKGESSVFTWLCRIAKNELFNFLKKRDNLNLNIDDFLFLADEHAVEETVETRESARAVAAALEELTEPFKEAFNLRVFAGLSFREIGDFFGKTENWARVTFFRARQKIIEKLEGMNYEM